MTDICRDSGFSYLNEYKEKNNIIEYDKAVAIKKNRDRFCKSIPNTIAIMDEIKSKCRTYSFRDRDYDGLLFAEKYYCTTIDSKTGKHCDEVLDTEGKAFVGYSTVYRQPFDEPFRKWDPALCDNSCIADLYPAIIDVIKKQKLGDYYYHHEFSLVPKLYENYYDNPPNCCGTDDGTIGADTKCKADITFVKNLPEDFINGKSNASMDNIFNYGRSDGEALAFFGGFFLLIWAILFLLFILYIVAYWKIFTKAGEKGWKAIIPFYNYYVLYDISWEGKYFWWYVLILIVSCVLLIIPILGWFAFFVGDVVLCVIGIMLYYYLSRSFGQGIGFTLGLIFFSPIFILVLAFSSMKYLGNGYEICQKEKAILANQNTNVV